MSSPRRARNISFAILGAGAAALAAAWLMPDAGRGFTLQAVLAVSGLTAVVLAGAASVFYVFTARAQAALLRGDGVLARWTISPERWRSFAELDARLNHERGPDLTNCLAPPRDASERGVEVIVGRAGVQVGDDYHDLPRGVYPVRAVSVLAGPPECFEFALLFPGSGETTTDIRRALRFPIPEGPAGHEPAQRILDEYRRELAEVAALASRPLIRIARPRTVALVMVLLAMLCGVAFGAGFMLRGRAELGQLPAILAIIGGTAGPGLLLLALVVVLRDKLR